MKGFIKVRYKGHRSILINVVMDAVSLIYFYGKTYKGVGQESV